VPVVAGGKLVNLASRLRTSADGSAIAGFVVSGTAPRKLLVRVIGPGLVPFGVPDAAANPRLRILSGQSTVVENDDWSAAGEAAGVAWQVGAFGLPLGSRDAAVVAVFNPGPYSVVGTGAGVVLLEVYDADSSKEPVLVNISTRGKVDGGGLIAGFVVGDAGSKVLVRGIGPALAAFGVAGFVQDPLLTIHGSDGTVIAGNDNWSGEEIAAAARSCGAFALPVGSRDASLLLSLPRGAYTATITAANGAVSGEGLVEIYHVR
jgi:hypothetical protein